MGGRGASSSLGSTLNDAGIGSGTGIYLKNRNQFNYQLQSLFDNVNRTGGIEDTGFDYYVSDEAEKQFDRISRDIANNLYENNIDAMNDYKEIRKFFNQNKLNRGNINSRYDELSNRFAYFDSKVTHPEDQLKEVRNVMNKLKQSQRNLLPKDIRGDIQSGLKQSLIDVYIKRYLS